MTRRTRQTEPAHVHPLWMRWLAALCLALVATMSTAQAVHVHGQWLAKRGIHVTVPSEAGQAATSDDHCPLCVAMHSALPVVLQTAPLAGALQAVVPTERTSRVPESRWTFALWSRPPPAA